MSHKVHGYCCAVALQYLCTNAWILCKKVCPTIPCRADRHVICKKDLHLLFYAQRREIRFIYRKIEIKCRVINNLYIVVLRSKRSVVFVDV